MHFILISPFCLLVCTIEQETLHDKKKKLNRSALDYEQMPAELLTFPPASVVLCVEY